MSTTLGRNIKAFRKNRGFTQEELADLLNITPQAISKWESEAGLPDVSMLIPSFTTTSRERRNAFRSYIRMPSERAHILSATAMTRASSKRLIMLWPGSTFTVRTLTTPGTT